MKKLTAASIAFAFVAGSAMAADLPYRKAPPPAYVPPAPVFNWTGLYGGVNIGYGFGNNDVDNGLGVPVGVAVGLAPALPWTLNNNLNGVVGGGQVGYNFQFNPWLVVGLEADIQASDVHSQSAGAFPSQSFIPGQTLLASVNQTKSVDWFGTVRGRIGVTPFMPNLMVYGTGGFAYGQVVHNFNATDFILLGGVPVVGLVGSGGVSDSTRTGWTAGGGVEWFPFQSSSLFSSFSLKVEYLYTDLGATNVTGIHVASIPLPAPIPQFAYGHSSNTRFQTVRAGLNWHFNPFAPAPVVAKF
jgi:outer membrane immunogenic protein